MANFIGTAGFFQEERAIKRRERVLLAAMILFAILEFGVGYFVGHRNLWFVSLAVVIAVPAIWWFWRRFDKEIRSARMEETGAAGEREIIPFLKKLPDTYTVVCDLDFADSYGNIDHLVIGPSGVFSIDVKNWKGSVAPDGQGEILCNDRPTSKRHVHAFVARTMDLKERLLALTHLDPYIQCLFVFPHTHLAPKMWGATGAVLCIHSEQLVEVITKPNPARAIPPADLPRLVAAAKALKDTIVTPQEPPKEDNVKAGGRPC